MNKDKAVVRSFEKIHGVLPVEAAEVEETEAEETPAAITGTLDMTLLTDTLGPEAADDSSEEE